MKIIASIQARLGSSRLPGKVLKEINGKPMLYWHIERLKRARLIDDIIVATTTNPLDDKIVDFCIPEISESRRQDLKPKAYIRSGSIYALKRDYLMVEGKRYGSDNSRPYILPPERAVNIDTEVDFMIAELMLNK